jgi:hypothetical protein
MQNIQTHVQENYSRSSLWLYIPLWAFFAYLYTQIFSFHAENGGNIVLSALYLVEFGVHEMSHIVVMFLPAILVASAGSIGEISFTCLVAFAAFRVKSYFAGIFGLLWVMLAMHSAGRYMADARDQFLPLVGPGTDPQHDWHFVFGQLGWLPYDTMIGGFIRGIGSGVGFIGLVFGLWLLILIAMNTKPKTN